MELVTLWSYRDPVDAHVARAILDGAGIPAVVWDDQLISVQWLYSTAVGGAKLKVPREDLDRARNTLSRESSGDLITVPEGQFPPSDGDFCPECGSDHIRPSRLLRRSLAVSLGVGFPLFLWRKRWICAACGHSWKARVPGLAELSQATLEAERSVQGKRGSYPGLLAFLVSVVGLAILYYVQLRLRNP